MSARLDRLLLASTAALALSACGGDDGGSEATIPTDAGLVVRSVPTISWDSDAYTATSGDVKVVLVNEEDIHHELAILTPDNKVVGDTLSVNRSGDVATATITLEPGQYRVFCVVPGHSNMDSTLTVTA